ncbi:MAG: tyrosine--tRNA ligase, partial [Salinivirgaceae bacterium]|nr:tyrosine--tRNA ligase [Salinivirgaceae bacterium]
KTESGNVWLDPARTSPYQFYQFWINTSDADAEKYIKIFTTLTKEEVDELVAEQAKDPGLRPLQKRLAKEVTIMVHSEEDYNMAVEASGILFGKSTKDSLLKLDERTFLDVFAGVPTYEISKAELTAGIGVLDLLTEKAPVFPSKGDLRRNIQGGGVSIDKEKVTDPNLVVNDSFLVNGKYLLAQKGKKDYSLLIAK